jgi:dephospho-CoA kinase
VGRWANKYVIGLTGNIATGKSVVRQMLQHLGAYTLDADGLVHQAMQPGAPAYKPVVEKFGMVILDEDKQINRQMLASIVFSNSSALKQLEDITHPIVRQAIHALVSRARQRVVVIEAIKLVEGDLASDVDAIWVVDSSPTTQLARLTSKRKMSDAEAHRRMSVQNPQSDKLAKAHVVIRNDGLVEDTWKQVQNGWEDVKKEVTRRFQDPTTSAAPAPIADAPVGKVAPSGDITVIRGMPKNAEDIAKFISAQSGKSVSRMDIMMSFGQKSYLIAQDKAKSVVGVLGWQVENLITRADECYIDLQLHKPSVVQSLVAAVEVASEELQSEVSFIFLPANTPADVLSAFRQFGYALLEISQIKIPAWREAVQESLEGTNGLKILSKQLREDRILKPI